VLPDLQRALEDPGAAVLVAPPGAGKTTLAPLALLDAPWLEGRTILVLEPRRLATRAAARRMAELLGEDDAGGTVGYRIRRDTRVSGRTRVEVVTEGILTRMLQSDPALSEVGCVVFDELHERSIHADTGLALALQCRELLRPDLRLLAMSATLEAEPVAELLGAGTAGTGAAPGRRGTDDGADTPGSGGGEGTDAAARGGADGASARPTDGTAAGGGLAPVVRSEGRIFPVETVWRETPVEGWIEPPAAATVLRALAEEEGDVLVFLPGAAEIRRTAERLEEAGVPGDVTVHPLFGTLSREEQDRAIRPSPAGRRKVVLATSIAETSLTIEGVRVVVDAGLMRVPRFDPGTGMTRLETVRVTRDAADQRRGRAGRLSPGVCYRLWTRGEERGLVPSRTPEILDADLAPLALELAVWGAEPDQLRWLTPPPEAAYAQAVELLGELEVLDADGTVTEHGRAVAALGVHPRVGHMLLRARQMGLDGVAADLAALLGERDILLGDGRAPDADLRLRLEALRRARSQGVGRVERVMGHRVHRGGLARALRESDHLRRTVAAASPGSDRRAAAPGPEAEARAGILLAFAYPDRIGRQREGARDRYLLRSGRGAAFRESQSLSGSEWLVAAEVEGRGREARIFRAAPVEAEEVEERFRDQIREVEEVRWDAEAGRVRAFRRRKLGALVLSEAPLGDAAPHVVAGGLVEGIRETGMEQALPWTRETTQLRERLHFLHRWQGAPWPDASVTGLEATLEAWLLPFLPGMRSLDDLKRLDLAEALLARVPWELRSRLDELAPSHLPVPSGSRIRIDYSDPRAPALAVKLQEVFGMTETPRIGGGRVPLTMKLLSPAQRPVQVTRDLASFWRDAYFDVRKDMRGRYPKHPWPEDPLSAQATRRTKRR
jgi:ATP-dependent helicase HrpB